MQFTAESARLTRTLTLKWVYVGHTVGGCATLGQACSGVPVLLPQLSEFERDTIIRRNKSVCEISLLLDIQL